MEYTLNCVDFGQGEEKAFTVKIKPDQSVRKLRKAIKNKNENDYNGIDAKHLTLYRHNVNTYDPKTFECKEADELLPLKEMWACFVLLPQSKSIYP